MISHSFILNHPIKTLITLTKLKKEMPPKKGTKKAAAAKCKKSILDIHSITLILTLFSNDSSI